MYQPVRLELYNFLSFKKEIFNFPEKGANIITGINEDNPSQKVNGAGKSSFQEGVGFAYLGNSLRDVSSKGLIRRGEKKGIIILQHFNTSTKKYFSIYRELNLKGSAVCRLYLSEDPELIEENEIRLSDVNEYNKKVFEILEISKEDLVKFYLLTSKYYKPFFNVPDSEKKEIVNRFSKTSTIDLENLENEIKPIEAKILVKGSDKERLEGGLDVLNETLSNLKKKDLKEEKKVLILNIEEKYTKIEKAIVLSKSTTKDYEKELETIKSEIENSNLTYKQKEINADLKEIEASALELTEDIKLINESLGENKKKVDALTDTLKKESSNIDLDFKKEIELLKDRRIFISEEIKELSKEGKDLSTKLSISAKLILDSITCPSCKFVFNLQSPTFNFEKENQLKDSLEKEIEEVEAILLSKEEVKNKIFEDISEKEVLCEKTKAEKRKSFDSQLNVIKQEIANDREIINQLEESLEESRASYRQIKNILTEIEREHNLLLQKQINILKKIDMESDNLTDLLQRLINKDVELEAINDLNIDKELKVIDDKIKLNLSSQKEIIKEIDLLKEEKDEKSKWINRIVSFKSYIANKSLTMIENYTNYFLNEMGTDLSVQIEGYKTLADGKTLREKITTEVLRDGISVGSYGSFSAGERGRIDMAIVLVFQELINNECVHGGLNLLMIDEVFDSVEPLGLELIINSLKDTNKKVLIVSQNEINALKSNTITATKRNGITKLIYNEDIRI